MIYTTTTNKKSIAQIEKLRRLAVKAKTLAEKTKIEEKAKAEKIVIIQLLKAKDGFSDEEIMKIVSLDKKTYNRYLQEMSKLKKK